MFPTAQVSGTGLSSQTGLGYQKTTYAPGKAGLWPTSTIFDRGYWWFGTWKTCIYQFAIVKNDMGSPSCKFP
ncbi:hypothetical protein N7530_005154 [Penicillium desertorum]|uniref:Uncharacterized protein n=1 Tax=Penicillium desertorum TaxID=1303715 RepID=A0A9X0BR34_9EURO|nr:hypothetical protein N7530_005154 [Penicillium desertorum]